MNHNTSHGDSGAYLRRLIEMDKTSLPPDGGERFNRLIFAGSPYLLQHAENPVDWYPWGEEAFAKAKAEDKPIFLSIGYATCHWCHVMASESFEDRGVAEVMNRYFVPVKVDREERPDIDDSFMTVSRLMTGSGGWPLNVFMSPDGRPFLTATYLPRKARQGLPGITELLQNVATLWRTQRGRVEQNCTEVVKELKRVAAAAPGEEAGGDLAEAAFRQLEAMYDPEWGGFGSAPKFPMPGNLFFLLRYWQANRDPHPLQMVDHTLRRMRQGGIFDQVGFGFHRYSVDRFWSAPHFEKMLYDQALLAIAYLEAFQAAGDPFFLTVAEEVFSFVLAEMTSPEGGFHSALDADTEGEEGKYYLWTMEEIRRILGDKDAKVFCSLYGVTGKGNFEGMNILHLPLSLADFAAKEGMTPELLEAEVGGWRRRLREEREKRVRPLRDEKVLTAWNGLMIAALAEAYAVTADERYLDAAEKAVAFINIRLINRDGRLLRGFHTGLAPVQGFLEDYAFFTQGLIALYEATFKREHLDDAVRLSHEVLRLFRDDESGGLFDTASDTETVLVRRLDASDSVIPSANAVAASNLVKIGRITGDDTLVKAGEGIVRAFMGGCSRQPAGYLQLLSAWKLISDPPVEITIAGRRGGAETTEMLRVIGRRFVPNLCLRLEDSKEGGTVAHVCAAGACRPPALTAEQLAKVLEEVT